MEEYIKKYPKQEKGVYAIVYAYGNDEANRICKEALDLNKRIKIIIDHEKLDYLVYKFI
jgi:hypothetical protein